MSLSAPCIVLAPSDLRIRRRISRRRIPPKVGKRLNVYSFWHIRGHKLARIQVFLAISACDVLDCSFIGRTTSHRLSGFSWLSFVVPVFFTGCCESDAFGLWIYPMRRNVSSGEYRRIDAFSSIVSGSARICVLFACLFWMHRCFEPRLHWCVACAE